MSSPDTEKDLEDVRIQNLPCATPVPSFDCDEPRATPIVVKKKVVRRCRKTKKNVAKLVRNASTRRRRMRVVRMSNLGLPSYMCSTVANRGKRAAAASQCLC